jgi:hypothetical protein
MGDRIISSTVTYYVDVPCNDPENRQLRRYKIDNDETDWAMMYCCEEFPVLFSC